MLSRVLYFFKSPRRNAVSFEESVGKKDLCGFVRKKHVPVRKIPAGTCLLR